MERSKKSQKPVMGIEAEIYGKKFQKPVVGIGSEIYGKNVQSVTPMAAGFRQVAKAEEYLEGSKP